MAVPNCEIVPMSASAAASAARPRRRGNKGCWPVSMYSSNQAMDIMWLSDSSKLLCGYHTCWLQQLLAAAVTHRIVPLYVST